MRKDANRRRSRSAAPQPSGTPARARETQADARARLNSARRFFLPALALLVLTVAAFAPIVNATGFLWDDDHYVTDNPHLEDAAGLFAMWFRLGSTTMYAPAVYTTLWVEYQLWGLDPVGYRLVNLGFHVASVLLLWAVLRRLEVRGAWLAAALFGVHPVMVESVAWVVELKNVQSLFFCLLALLAYLRFSPLDATAPPPTRTRRLCYALAVLLFAAALLSKPMVVTLPVIILILIWWKRGRIGKGDLLSVAPLLAMSLAAGLLTMYVEHRYSGTTGAAWELSLLERILVAGRAVWFYAAKLAWPVNLLSVYPRWQVSAGAWWQYLFPVGAAALVGALWFWRGRLGRGPLAAVLCFGVLVSPVVGLFNVAYHLYSFVADHFQYHAAPALLTLFAWGVSSLRSSNRLVPRRAVDVASAMLLLVLAVLTSRHVPTYHDEKSRCLRTIEGNPQAWSAMYNLGVKLKAEGNPQEALRWYAEALKVTPDNAEALNNAGTALMDLGDAREAVRHYREALRLAPNYPLAHNNLATALASLGDRESAIREYREALRLKPEYADARLNLAKVLAADGRVEEAVREYREALRIRPDDADAHHNLAITLARAGRFDEAIAEYRVALRLKPDDAAIRRDFGTALANSGNLGEAIGQYREALRLKPDDAESHNGLALALARAGQAEEAAGEFEASLRLKPDYAEAHNNFGTLLATQGRVQEAMAHYAQAIRFKPDYAEAHSNAGLILALAGRSEEAIQHYREALRIKPDLVDAHIRLGASLAESGRVSEAIGHFEQALRLDPENTAARTNLERARALSR